MRCGGGWKRIHGSAIEALPTETGSNKLGQTFGTPRQSSTRPAWRFDCAYRKSHLGRRRPAHTCCKSDVRAIFSSNNREAREVHAANCEQGCLVVSGSENWNTYPRVAITARTATFRLRVARSGDGVRQLAVRQRRLRVSAGARAAVPVCPWPVTGASWIRDNTPGRTSRAGTGKPR